MGVKMHVDSVCSYLFKMNSYLTELPIKCEAVETQILSFKQDQSLDGMQYNNQKVYMEQIHTPILRGIKNFCSEMISANNQYQEAITSYFSGINEVDEDKWRDEYEQLRVQYENANSMLNYIIETIRQMTIMGGGNHMVTVDDYTYMVDSYQEQIDILYSALEMYQERIERVGQMLAATSGIYFGAESMENALKTAIHTLSMIPYNADTKCYAFAAVDLSSINQLDTTWNNLQIAKEVREILKDDLLEPEEYELLDQEEKMEYARKLYEKLEPWIPNLTSKLGSGTVEIPIMPGLVLYTGVSVSGKIKDTGSAGTVDLAREKNNGILASWTTTVGNLSGKISGETGEIKYSYKIDDKTSAYTSFNTNVKEHTSKIENGVTTTVEDGSVTSKSGLKISNDSDSWEEIELSDYDTGTVSEPKVSIDLPPIFSPSQVPVPAF